MDEASFTIKNILHNVLYTSYNFGKKLIELQSKDYPSNTPEKLIDILIKLNDEIIKNLDSIEIEFSKNPRKPDEVFKDIIRYGQLLSVFHEMIEYVEKSSRENISPSPVYLIEEITKEFDKRFRFMLLPMYEYNYGYNELITPLKGLFGNVIKDPRKIFDTFGEKLAIFKIPTGEGDNILLHCMLGHEVGHYVNEIKNISDNLMKKIEFDKREIDKIVSDMVKAELHIEAAEVRKLSDFVTKETIKVKVTKNITDMTQNWLIEILSDSIAFRIFGLAYFFPLIDISLKLEHLDWYTKNHPPPRLRIQFLLNEIEELGYIKEFSEKKNQFFELIINQINNVKLLLDSISEYKLPSDKAEANRAIKEVMPDMKEELKNISEIRIYTPNHFISEVPILIESLKFFIPPNEIIDQKKKETKAADLISILNAGWAYKLLYIEDFYKILNCKSIEDKLNAEFKLNQMICKALELSTIHSKMKSKMQN